MSTDTLTDEAENDVLPMTHAVEVGASDEELPPEVVAEEEPDDTPSECAHDREREGLNRIFLARRAASKAYMEHAEADRKAKGLKKKWEAAVEDLDAIIADVESDQQPLPLEAGGFLSDPTKADINAQFAKPEAIQPLPATDLDEFFRRKRRDTRLDSLGLTPKVAEILAEAGFVTVMDLDKLWEAEAPLTSIKVAAGAITEPRAEKIREALEATLEAWQKEWDEEWDEGHAFSEADAPKDDEEADDE